MRFKQYYTTLLLEGQNEDQALARLKKAGKEEAFTQLLSITEPYKSNVFGKNNKHLPKLAEFYLQNIPLNIIKSYYDKFIQNPKISSKPIDKMNFHDFEQLVDSSVENVNIQSKEVQDHPVYEDQNVKIFLGDDKNKCIRFGQGRKFGFCIARTDQSNLYHGYRKSGATFYFVYFKNAQAKGKAPAELIVIHAYPDDEFQINYAIPNRDHHTDEQHILQQFPALKPAFDQNVIKYIPHTEKEELIYGKIEKARSIFDLKTIDERLLYLEMGHEIRPMDWNDLSKLPNFDAIMEKYIEVGMYDVPDFVLENFPKLNKRYQDKLMQRCEIKLDPHHNFMFSDFTNDELNLILKTPALDEKFVQKISDSPHLAFRYAKLREFNNVPEVLINSIASDPDFCGKYVHELNYELEKIPPAILDGIAYSSDQSYSLAYILHNRKKEIPSRFLTAIARTPENAESFARELEFKNVPPEILKGVSRSQKESFRYAKALDFKNVPEEIIQGIANPVLKPNSKNKEFADALRLDFKNVPENTLNELGKDAEWSYNFARATMYRPGYKIPPQVINGIAKEPIYAYSYAKELQYKNIPQPIYDTLVNSKWKTTIPKDFSVAPE